MDWNNSFQQRIYIIKQDIRINVYMLAIAGQTAGPIGLKFVVDTHGWPGVLQAKKNDLKKSYLFYLKLNFSSTALQLV